MKKKNQTELAIFHIHVVLNQNIENESETNEETESKEEDQANKEIAEIVNDMNNERMLENDFDLWNQQKNAGQNTRDEFVDENLMSQKNIYDMLIQFNFQNGSSVLDHLVKTKVIDSELWQEAKGKRRSKKKAKKAKSSDNLIHKFVADFMSKLNGSASHTLDDEVNIDNIWLLDGSQRVALYHKWRHSYANQLAKEIARQHAKFNLEASKLKELRLQEDSHIMKDAFIIAMTTTGSSRYHNILKDIGPRIVIVEEAAEVFEAHIVSALSKKCEHLILIGRFLIFYF
jgi:hypothetical protein